MLITPLNFDRAFSPFQRIRGVHTPLTLLAAHYQREHHENAHDFTAYIVMYTANVLSVWAS